MAARGSRSKAPPGQDRPTPIEAILAFVQWLPPWMHDAGTEYKARRRGRGYQIEAGQYIHGYVNDSGRPRLPNVLDFLPSRRVDDDCTGK